MAPYFSVVIPTYNRATSILSTLHSVSGQSFRDFECLVVDDGSADSAQLNEVVSSLGDARFRVINRPNGGGGAARNSGIDAAAGSYVAFLDSDDHYHTSKLQVVFDAISVSSASREIVYFSQVVVDRGVGKQWVKPPRGPFIDEPIDDYLILRSGFIQTSTIVMRRDLAKQVRFDERLPFGQDTDFCIRAAAAGAEFHMLTPPLVNWKDDTAANRVSSNSRYESVLDWTDRNKSVMSRRSYLAYRGWHGAKAAYLTNRRLALGLYWEALTRFAFPPGLALRVTLQLFVPPARYRSVANMVVKLFGSKRGSLQ